MLKENSNESYRNKSNITRIFFVVLGVFCIISLIVYYLKDSSEQEISQNNQGKIDIQIQKSDGEFLNYSVEIADDPSERTRGLMYRNSMPDNEGMLFIFPDSAPRSFWMKNTEISLDILYFDENFNLIKIHENTTPLNDKLKYPSEGNSKYVLELNAGISKKDAIRIGDKLIIN